MSPRLVFYGPAKHEGGTTLLLARVAAEFARRGRSVRVVDFAHGALAGHLARRGLPFVHTKPSEGGDRFGPDELVMLTLLHAKLLLRGLTPDPATRFLFWSTHPQDGFKLLPGFNLVRHEDNRFRRWGGRIMHPTYWARVRRFLDEGARRSGVVYMDQQNSLANEQVYALTEPRTVVPVATEWAEPAEPTAAPEGLRRVTWVGRLEHFKVEPLGHLLRSLDALCERQNSRVRFDVIGDGSERTKLEAEARTLRRLETVFHGTLAAEAVEAFLRRESDLVVGHGLSILEGARLGLPSLVVDGSYVHVPDGRFLARWLQDEREGEVGHLLESPREMKGEPLGTLFDAWWSPERRALLGRQARAHWEYTHAVGAVVDRAERVLENNTFTWEAIRATGFDRLDRAGLLLEGLKRARQALRRGQT